MKIRRLTILSPNLLVKTTMTSSENLSHAEGPPLPDDAHSAELWPWLHSGFKDCLDNVCVKSLHQSPDHLSFLAPRRSSQASDHLEWTYGQVDEASNRIANALIESGVRPLDRIVTFLPNGLDWVLLFCAAVKIHAVVVPLDPKELGRKEQLENLIGDVKPVVAVVWDEQAAHQLDSIGFDFRLCLVCGEVASQSAGWHQLARLVKASSADPPSLPASFVSSLDDLAIIFFTSGTTSSPKGCPYTTRMITSRVSRSQPMPARHVVTSVNYRPIHFLSLEMAFEKGGMIVFPGPTYSEEGCLDAIINHGCEMAILVPAVLKSLAKNARTGVIKMGSLKSVALAGDYIDRDLVQQCDEKLKPALTLAGFGMTECATTSIGWSPPPRELSYDENGIAGVGRPSVGCKVKICRTGTRDLVPRGEHGDLYLCFAAVIDRYLDGRHSELWHVDERGQKWFATGDVAHMDADGIIYIVARSKDVIVKGGVNIFPAVIEGFFSRMLNVEACNLLQIPH